MSASKKQDNEKMKLEKIVQAERADSLLESGLKECKTCKVVLSIVKFEKTRSVCKECRQVKRAKAIKDAVPIDRSTVPKPAVCAECLKSGEELEFTWRTDIVKGGWKNTCNQCLASKG